MNIKEKENQLSISLNFRIAVNVIAYLGLVGFMGYRLFLVSRLSPATLPLGAVVPRLKISNFEKLSEPVAATGSAVRNVPISDEEPFD